MRRIATLVATGAVAAAAAITLAASSASADVAATTVKSTFTGGSSNAGGYSATATHSWASHGRSRVSGAGTYTRTSKGTSIKGYVKDTRSGKYHGGLFIKVWAKDLKHYDYVIVVDPKHGAKAYFHTPTTAYNTHLQIAEVLAYKSGGKWKLYHPSNPGKFYTVF